MPKITFIEANGNHLEVEAPVGMNMMEISHLHGVDIEGACGGCLACAPCHVIVRPDWYAKLEEKNEEEEDMLDLAFEIEDTSRLCCQIIMSEELDGLVVALPGAPMEWKQAA